MFTVLTCIRDDHDLRLVVVAALICVASVATAVGAYYRARRAKGGQQLAWISFTGLVAGSGVWATHFMAMLAYQPGLQIRYEILITVASLGASVVGMVLGFGIAARRRERWAAPVGGAVAGLGVGVMHFMGMSAVRAQMEMVWNPAMVAAALVIGATGAALALACAGKTAAPRRHALAVGVLVGAIVGLHFTAMAAITLVPDPTVVLSPELIGRAGLVALVVVMATLILVSAGSLLWMERFSSRTTLEGLREGLDSAPSALAFFDTSHRLMFWNKGYADFLAAFSLTPSLGLPYQQLLAGALASAAFPAQDVNAEAWRGLTADTGRLVDEIQLPDGRFFRCEAGSTPTGGLMLVISDITEQHEIRRVLGEAKERAEAASRAKTDFVANISHEIRTPLNGILGIAQVMEREASEPAQLDRLRIIRDCGQGLMAVLNDVLDISRIEAGQMMLDYKDFDLVEAVEGSCAAFVSMAAQKGLAFTIDIDAEAHGCWWGDGDRLRQVLANLASNAVKFTESGSVGVSVSATESGVAFRITDTGVGIPADRLDDLFGKFQQLDASATRRHGGAGLGLALCRELVTLMGGVLTVTSRPGAGSKFSFEAPLGRDVRAPYETRQAGPDAEAEAAPGLQMEAAEQPIRILAAEDNLTNRLIVKALLEPMGVELTMVENGAQAIEAVEAGAFDLVLMDIQMPVLDGMAATAAIRGLEARRGGRRLPVVAVTANVMDFQRAQYLAAGIDAIVAKPIEAAALFAVIEQCLADPPTGAIASAA